MSFTKVLKLFAGRSDTQENMNAQPLIGYLDLRALNGTKALLGILAVWLSP